MIDRDSLQRKFARLDDELVALKRLAAMQDMEFRADADRLSAVERRLEVAIEACVDIARLIIGAEMLRLPATIADSFVVLGEAGIVDTDFVPVLCEMARFRNRLVHLYDTVDAKQLIRTLRAGVPDLQRFRADVSRFIDAS